MCIYHPVLQRAWASGKDFFFYRRAWLWKIILWLAQVYFEIVSVIHFVFRSIKCGWLILYELDEKRNDFFWIAWTGDYDLDRYLIADCRQLISQVSISVAIAFFNVVRGDTSYT